MDWTPVQGVLASVLLLSTIDCGIAFQPWYQDYWFWKMQWCMAAQEQEKVVSYAIAVTVV